MNFTDEASTTLQQYHPVILTNSTSITWTSYVFFYFNVINIILGLPANCFILWIMLTGRGAGVVSDFFSLNLALCEIFYCLGSMVCFSLSYVKYPKFVSFIAVVPFYARPLFLCLICVERYVAVVHPVTFLKYKPLKYRLTCSAVVWVLLAGFSVFCLFILSSNNIFLYLCVALPQYSIFLTIKLFCGFAVLRTLKHPGPGERVRQREVNHMKKRAFNIILTFTVAMVIDYTPLFLTAFLYDSLSENYFTTLWVLCICISFATSGVQPFMYMRQFGNFKLVTRQLFSYFTEVVELHCI